MTLNFASFLGRISSPIQHGETSGGNPKRTFDLVTQRSFYKTFVEIHVTGEKRVSRFDDLAFVVGDRLRVDGPIGSVVRKGKATINYIQALYFEDMGRNRKVNPIDRPKVKAIGREKPAPFGDSV